MLFKRLLLVFLLLISICTYSQNNKDSIDYINYFLKSENYWGSITGVLTEASNNVFRYSEYVEFSNGLKSKWEAYVFSNHLEKIVINEVDNSSIIFFDFHFIKSVTVYNTKYLYLRQEESEEEKSIVTIRVDRKVSTDDKEFLKLAFKLLFKGVEFEEVKH